MSLDSIFGTSNDAKARGQIEGIKKALELIADEIEKLQKEMDEIKKHVGLESV